MNKIESITETNLYERLLPSHPAELTTDVSVLLSLARRVPLESSPTEGIRLLVPKVAQERLFGHGDLLYSLDQYYTFFLRNSREVDHRILSDNIQRLREYDSLRFLPHLTPDEEIEAIVRSALPASPKTEYQAVVDFLEEYLVQLLTYVRRERMLMLIRTRRTLNILREHLPILELASGMDRLVERKQEISGTLFGFPGGRTLKIFLALVLDAAGLSEPTLAVPGLLLTVANGT